MLVIPKNDVNKAKAIRKVYTYHEFDLLQRIFTSVLQDEGIKGLVNFLNKPVKSKKEFIKHKLRNLNPPHPAIRRLAESCWYKCLVKCLKRIEECKIKEFMQDFEEFGLVIIERRYNVAGGKSMLEGYTGTTITFRHLQFSRARELLEHRIERYMEDIEKHDQELTKLKRKLVDVKTKWSEYEYPDDVKSRKNSELIDLLKLLGFECEILEVYFSNSEIRISSRKL